ncbi:MAG: hypothetical protein M1815_001849 [Lichina confinis]|nr:MAG: hypothetical protein M1815_001849 [Lichina confinis]
MGQARRITVVGSLNMDLVMHTARLPSPGETLTGESFETGCGGKGANQAVACARLSRTRPAAGSAQTSRDYGHDPNGSAQLTLTEGPDDGEVHVRMVGAVGDDSFGESMKAALRDDAGVDVSGVQTLSGTKTGVAVITVETVTGENYILLAPNANHAMTPSMFQEWPRSAPRPDLIVLELEIPLETALQVLRAAKDAGLDVLLNPAPAVPLPDEAYPGITHLVLNETEAAILSGISLDRFEDEETVGRVCDLFLDRGVQFAVIVTLGGRGAYFCHRPQQPRHGEDHGRPSEDRPRRVRGIVAASKVSVVDTTAAGDTFVGAYAVQIARAGGQQVDMTRIVDWANRAAAKTVQGRGAQSAIPWLDEMSP